MNILSKNIYREECQCRCGCGYDTCDVETANVIQDACDHFAKELGVVKVIAVFNSWCRCKKHNKEIGGADNSFHLYGKAVDWFIKHVTAAALYKYIDEKYPDRYGLGIYDSRIHFDCRAEKYRYVGGK